MVIVTAVVAVVALVAIGLTVLNQNTGTDRGGALPGTSAGAPVRFAPGTTMADLSQASALRVGTKFDQPLFGQRGPDGTPAGFDVEIAKIVAADLGIPADRITYAETPSASREDALERGEVDIVVATYTINDTRRQRVSFAGPYYVAGQDLMVRAGTSAITGPGSLRGARAVVCTVLGSTPAENIKQYVDASNLVLLDRYAACADALRTGQVDAVTTDNVILIGLIAASQGAFTLVGEPFTEEPYGIGIRRGDVEFCRFVDQALQDAAADGRYASAWTATAGTVEPTVPALPTAQPCR